VVSIYLINSKWSCPNHDEGEKEKEKLKNLKTNFLIEYVMCVCPTYECTSTNKFKLHVKSYVLSILNI